MLERLRETWLPRLLFVLTTAAALGLLLAVLLAPRLAEGLGPADDGLDLVRLFARDAVVRRTAVASGLGLLVTAFVFFRPVPPPEEPEKRPPDNIAGA
jgi:hypothetical protein